MRTFIAIDIPEEIKEEIIKLQEQLPEFKGKFTERENLHLTLKFLGEVDEEKIEKIKSGLRGIKSKKFEVEIDSIGFFSEKFIRIIWLHITNCEKLQKEIDNSLGGLFEKEKRFMSHLTIVRVKTVRDKKNFINALNKIKIPSIKFKVSSFELKKSILTEEGPVYETVESYTLK